MKQKVASLTSCEIKTKTTVDIELLCQEHYKNKTASSDLLIWYSSGKTSSTLGILELLLFNYCYHYSVLKIFDIPYTYAFQKQEIQK